MTSICHAFTSNLKQTKKVIKIRMIFIVHYLESIYNTLFFSMQLPAGPSTNKLKGAMGSVDTLCGLLKQGLECVDLGTMGRYILKPH